MRDAHTPLSVAAEAGPSRVSCLQDVCLIFRILAAACLFVWIGLFSPTPTLAFVNFGLGGGNAADETSRYPIKIELRGFLNTDPESGTLVVVSLGVNTFQDIYYLDVRQARLVDDPHSSITAILRRAGKYGSLVFPGVRNYAIFLANKAYPVRSSWMR